MPGLTYSSPGAKRESESEEEETSTPATSDAHLRVTSKRVRLNDGSPSPATSPAPSNNAGTPDPGDLVNGPHSDPAAFQPGSIFKISLVNFVTYSEVDVHPGPSLNMILGPNGTGKSTIVCAICMGLGFNTSNLGRAKDPSEFIKYGADEATIEIELIKKPDQRRNTVIRRHISKTNKKSTWYLNGKQVPLKEIAKSTASFAIQIDNLCQFLPQDKVAEFAAMDSIQLLESTQRAVAEPEMAEMHQSLKQLGKERRETQEKVITETKQLNSLKQRQEAVQRDVDRLNERVQIQEQIRRLELAKICAECKESRNEFSQAKEAVKVAEREQVEIQDQVEPRLQELKTKAKYKKIVNKLVVNAKIEVTTRNDESADLKHKFDKLKQDIFANGQDIKAREKEHAESKRKATVLQRKVANMENQLTETPPAYDNASFNEQSRAAERKMVSIETDATEIRGSISDLRSQGAELKSKMTQASQRLDNLSSQIGKQSQALGKISRDSLEAWDWIQAHQDEFEKPILGPPAIVCSITDPRVAPQIESMFSKLDFCTFTCQSKNDFKKLHQLIKVQQRLSYVQLREVRRTVQTFQPPISRDELKQLDGDGWAIDFMQGPDLVLGLLCEQNRLNSTAVMRSEITSEQHHRIERSNLTSWVDPKSKYSIIRRREYGPGAVTTRVDPIRPPTVWTDHAVDTSASREYEAAIERYNSELEELKNKANGESAKLKEMGIERAEIIKEKENLLKHKDELQRAVTSFRMLPQKIEQDKNSIEHENTLMREAKEEIAQKQDEKERLLLAHVQLAVDYAASIASLRQAHEQLFLVELTFIEATMDEEFLKEQNKSTMEALAELEKGIVELIVKQDAIKKKARELSTIVQSMQTDLREKGDNETLEYLGAITETVTLQQILDDIATEQERLQLNDNDDPQLLQQYERRKEMIEVHTRQATQYAERFEELELEIRAIRSRWEPRLDELVGQISTAFSQCFEDIGCAGQVLVEKDEENFAAWAISIHVKFRENEQLARLTAQRQSGGERAVSTIFYLMSLQRLTRSPFRVVDEINQGMDQRNERTVHEQMVKIACEGDSSQYFLITPKLLTGLKYHPKMRTHIIASGEYMPTDTRKIDFKSCVDIALRVKAGF
ncbi:MAG: Structural maintenance of chromosomes protein 5 [Vezdaea aestivalis]|nr:MAG: Structural maintenance of chromosomes protein 5 [Vezdaea aestivalis]